MARPRYGPERRIGVPFAASTYASAISTESAQTIAQRWRPIKSRHYEKLERDQRKGSVTSGAPEPALSSIAESSEKTRSSRRPTLNGGESSPQVPGAYRRSSKKDFVVDSSNLVSAIPVSGSAAASTPSGRSRERTMSELSTSGGGTKKAITPQSLIRSHASVVDEHLTAQLFTVVPEPKLLFSCGHWDHSMRATSLETGRLVQTITQHSDVVTCIASAKDFGRTWLVTGSRDCTLMVWEINADKDLPLGSHPVHILYGHDDAVTTVAINVEFDMIVSGSDDGTIIVHSLHSGVYIRSIVAGSVAASKTTGSLPAATAVASAVPAQTDAEAIPKPDKFPAVGAPSSGIADSAAGGLPAHSVSGAGSTPLSHRKVTWVGVSREAFITAYAADDQMLMTYSINGELLATKVVPERLYAFVISEDGKVLLTGGDSCLVVLRWIRNLEFASDGPRRALEAVLDGSSDESQVFSAPIRSLHLTKMERLLVVGLESGEVRHLAQDSDYLRQRLQRKLKEIGIL